VYESTAKGSLVFVMGRLVSSEWETETGEKRTQIEIRADRIQVLEKRPDQEELPLDGLKEEERMEVGYGHEDPTWSIMEELEREGKAEWYASHEPVTENRGGE